MIIKYGLDGFPFFEGMERVLFHPMALDLSPFETLTLNTNLSSCSVGIVAHLYCFNEASKLLEQLTHPLKKHKEKASVKFRLQHFKNHIAHADRQMLSNVYGVKIEFLMEVFPCQFAINSLFFS